MLEGILTILIVLTGLGALLGVTVGILAICAEVAGLFEFESMDRIVGVSFGGGIASAVLFFILLLAGMAMYGGDDQKLVVGHCYEAVRTESHGVMPISTGKTVIMVPTHTTGVTLMEVRCIGD